MADAIHFLGGIGSSQFDLAMVEQADGNLATAAARYGAARDAFERGGATPTGSRSSSGALDALREAAKHRI
ncbi:MAG TPA: hypothetical protein VH986_02800 [Acidimicrobiia bacterium]